MIKMSNIIMYYGKECPHCHAMLPMVDKIKQEEDIEIEKKEVWHDEKNADEMRSNEDIISPACGGDIGVPCFISKKTKKALCGEVSYEEFKDWVLDNK